MHDLSITASAVVPFNFNSHEVRTLTFSGQPWFVAKDVCDVLGYQNTSKTISDHLDDDERSNVSLGRQGSTNLINESGLYTLIMRSKKPEAKPFRKWVTAEVLPTIRRTGEYSLSSTEESTLDVPELARDFAALRSIAETAGLSGNAAILSAGIAARKITGHDPLALIGATHLVSETQKQYFTPTDLGNRKGSSGAWFNRQLESAGFQTQSRDAKKRIIWTPTERGMEYCMLFDTGKKHGDGAPVQQIKWSEDVIALLDGFKEVAA